MSNTWKIYMLATISFLVGTSQFVISGILDQIAASINISVSSAGQLITAFALGNAIGTPIVMVAMARLNQRKKLLTALTVILIGIVSTVTLPGFGFLMAARVVLGVGTGVFVVTAYGIAASLASKGREVGAMANVAMGYSASLVFGVPVGRVIAEAYDWKIIFWSIGFFSLLAVFAVARLIPATEGEEPVPIGKQLALLKNPRIAVALSVTLFMFISYSAVYTYIAPLLTTFISQQRISVVLFVIGIASLIGSKLGGFSADRFGIARTLIIGMVIQALALVLLSAVSGSVIIITLLFIWSIAVWTFGATQNFNLISLAPEASGIMLSLNSSFVQLGFAAGAGVGGIVAGSLSIMAVTWIGAVSVALAAIIAYFFFSRARSFTSSRG
ncbi:MFS transporter [Oceanobacillus kimchii]|uniref:MFS transporter n=1 Tax=Oceanobacillus kimchii TaxID=746691 RepID=UPI003C7468CB